MKLSSISRMLGNKTLMLVYILLIGTAFMLYDWLWRGDAGSLALRIIPLLVGLALTIYAVQNRIIASLEVKISKIETENKSLEIKLHSLDTLESRDPLTGLPTFVFQNDRISVAIQWAKRIAGYIALYRIQIGAYVQRADGVDELSDNHVVVQKAERLKALMAEGISLLHIGRNDFLLIADGIKDVAYIQQLAARVDAALRQPISMTDGTEALVTDKSALAVYPWDGEDSDTLVGCAESNLRADRYMSNACMARLHSRRSSTSTTDPSA